METARAATAADSDEVRRLWDAAVEELDGQRGGLLLAGGLVRPSDAPAAALGDPGRLLVLGLIDEVPVGLASVRADRQRREPVGEIEVVYVEPNARQVGVGEAMVEVVLEWCRASGLVGVDAPALPGNRQAKAFFETNGFLARLLIMHHPVSGPAPGRP